MIYLDVTSSCKSPLNTGVQRVVRGLFRSLSAITPITPLVWDPGLETYCKLSGRERGFLTNPFAGAGEAGDAEPGRRANPIPFWSKFKRRASHRWNRLDLPAVLTSRDTLFVPEIFQDNRVQWLARLAPISPARWAAVCHDAIAWSRPDITPPARQEGFAAYLETLSRFDHVFAISQETATALHDFWLSRALPEPPFTVHPWPVNHAGAARPPYQPGTQAPLSVLCVGTLEPRKNHLVLLEACEQLWQHGLRFELILVGRTTAQWGRGVLAQVERLQQAGHALRWLRHVDDLTLQSAYENCAFTVFPSLIEGFGLPILESLWYGRPCVCGHNGAIGEVAADGGCLTVDQTTPVTLAAGIKTLLVDAAVYQRFCAEATRRRFDTWESLASSLLPLLSPAAQQP